VRWARPGYSLLLALLVTGPLLGPGYLLLRDAVSTPRSYLTDTALGLTAPPRAVPQDFALALASHVIDGGVVVKVLLVLGLWLAGWGAARLVALVLPGAGAAGQFVASTIAVWNPYVAERLLLGHWSLLVGYGCLPWIAAAMLTLRGTGGWPAVWGLAFWIALAGLTPTGLVLGAIVALVCVAAPGAGWRRRSCAAAATVTALVGALPWLVVAAMGPPPGTANPPSAPGVQAFAARAEPGLGTLGSLASLGGIWNGQAVPDSRTTLFAVSSAVVLLGIVAAGLPAAARRPAAVPLVVLAVVSVLVPCALATGPGLRLLSAVVDAAPGVGLLRDGQKWVALAVPGYALAGAGAVQGSVATLGRRLRPAAAAAACCLALILTLPDLAWGVWSRMTAVHYPGAWTSVAAAVNADPRTVVALPAGSTRRFPWAGRAPVLDPLPRWLRADVLSAGDLPVAGAVVPGEGAHARAVEDLLLTGPEPGALARAGVGWLVVESDSAGDMGAAGRTLAALTPVYADRELTLYRIGGDTARVPAAHRTAALIAHAAWLAMLVAGGAGAFAAARRRRPR